MLLDADAAPHRGVPEISASDFVIPGKETGVSIHVRNKRLAGDRAVDDQHVVVFVHGATYAGSVAFDHPMFGGGSWLDYIALHGFDAYLFDVRGYGRSSRPIESGDRAWHGVPYARTPEAIADLTAVVDFVRRRTGASKVNLIGWSWGTAIAGGFASDHGDLVRHLVMVAPLWTIRTSPVIAMSRWMMSAYPTSLRRNADFLGAFRNVAKSEARKRWLRGVDADVAEQLMPKAEFEAWWRSLSNIQRDPRATEDSVRVPNGVMADLTDIWAAGGSTYAPEGITAPTLLLLGEWDVDTPPYMAQELFSRLRSASYKRLEILARGTHSMALELNRVDLYRRARDFLETRFI